MVQAPVQHGIQAEFEERFAGSLALHGRSQSVIPGGIAHDGRYLRPFPIYIDHAQGAHKWDVDGHELIDYAVGHGALLLGHNDPDVTAAVSAQLGRGTHYGACHEGEILWAEQIRKMIPSAEQVRFTSSGTEATMLAIRLARAATGRTKIVKFEGHFHGWHDYVVKGEKPPFDADQYPGVPAETLSTVDVLPNNDLAAVEARLRQGDVAGVIIEPSGGSWGTIPLVEGFLQGLRELTAANGTVLIFDEVITGFRWSAGGAQAREKVIPDVTSLAKIVAGGLPGGAVAGRNEVMQHLAFKDEPSWNKTQKVPHPGTYNANPLAAAAGLTCLRKIADGAAQAYCDNLATRTRAGMNTILEQRNLPGFVWGDSSAFHIAIGANCTNRTAGDLRFPEGVSVEQLKALGKSGDGGTLRLGMLIEGVDLFGSGGMFSTAHTDADVDHTLAAFDHVLGRMAAEGRFD